MTWWGSKTIESRGFSSCLKPEHVNGAEMGAERAKIKWAGAERWAGIEVYCGAGADRGAEVEERYQSVERTESAAHNPLKANNKT